ncbi:Cytochrome P450 [Metarhizium album ARSEF 1941]|uniref:Cytochrome P450 n=1 Tax=Metarhizium album (strain ARSEF 1941) TaxID=1081103 RepID=A0A0B2WYG3_METAS|nr:Cytochrome P450 [Metarhizium album ARSEF 1941]KHN98467.1 Cytochrome P450 [Metarhizium album ARSEF 1941]
MSVLTTTGAHLVALLLLYVLVRVIWEVFLSPLRTFPGPFASKFTDAWRAFLTTRGNVDSTTRGWHRRWGQAVRIGPNTISLSDPKLIKEVYASTSKKAWKKSQMYRVNDALIDGRRISNIFNTHDEEFHKKYARPIAGFWTLTKLLELEPLMDETIQKFVNKLGSKFADGLTPDTVFAWDFAANVTFGEHYGFIDQEKDIEGMIKESSDGLRYFAPVSQAPWLDGWLDKNPIYRIGPKPLVNGLLYTVRRLADYQRKLAEGTLERAKVDTLIDKYYGLKDIYPDVADGNQLVNWLMLNVLAGGDSTAGALRPIVYHLGKRPEAQTKLQSELKAAQLSVPAQWRDICKLPYLDAVIREAARLNPAVGLMFEREVPAAGFRLPDGRFVPAGTNVGINPNVVTRDVGVFGEDVDEFVPERWLQRCDEDGDQFVRRRRRMEESGDFMFGAGSRTCTGKLFAKMEMYKLMATLYTMFHVSATPHHFPPSRLPQPNTRVTTHCGRKSFEV